MHTTILPIYLPALPPIEKSFLITKQHRDAFIKAD
jgi:transposase